MEKPIEVLLCYRGRFNEFVISLAEHLCRCGVRVTYDREILADNSGFDEKADVDWWTLGEAPQNDTRWRAPLRAAVDSAEMVTFALDFFDESENVINEIRWAIQLRAHTFFLIHGGPTDPESQGIIIGSLAAHCMLIFWMKNRDPAHWRDAWQIEHSVGKYIISDKPMTEDEWIKERATLIEAEATEVEAIEDNTEE
jgi:hypothetical protein